MGGAPRLTHIFYRNDVVVVIQNSKIRILSIRCEATSKVTEYLLTCTLIYLFTCNMYCIIFNCALNPALFFGLQISLYNNYVNHQHILIITTRIKHQRFWKMIITIVNPDWWIYSVTS